MMSDLPQVELLTLPAMARALRVTQRWLRTEADAGRLPAVRAGKRYLFSRRAVDRTLLERAENLATPEAANR